MAVSMFAEWLASETATQAAEAPFMSAPIPEDNTPRVACPHCGKRCKVPAGANLSKARCPKCDGRMVKELPPRAMPGDPVKPVPVVEPIAEPIPAPVAKPRFTCPWCERAGAVCDRCRDIGHDGGPIAEPVATVPEVEPIPAPVPVPRRGKLVDIYRPRTVAELSGQDWARDVLTEFLRDPSSGAFLFSGPTGTGKTSAALALAADLGVAVEHAECGGLHQISSGEQTGESVKRASDMLWTRPMLGNGWRVLIVNEADCITSNAAFKWLDVLENLPPRSVVVFTTNDPDKLPRRLRDRCEPVQFVGGALILRAACEELARRVWAEQTGRTDCPSLESFGEWSVDGEASFRRLLQLMEPYVRIAKARGEIAPGFAELAEPEAAKRGRKRS